ncbi:MAG: thiol-disulfide isomerase/thioredoxin, partial [Bradymonadia bacterium]
LGEGCSVGEQLPTVDRLLDQLNNDDVALGQFYGEMLLIEFGGMWCGPCRELAEEVATLQYGAERAGDDYGFRVLSTLNENNSFDVTTAGDLFSWAASFDLSNPILGGASAGYFNTICNVAAVPTLLIVDPLFEVRWRQEGVESGQDLAGLIATTWDEFRAENPDWVSPRCRGVVDPGVECGCVDDRTAPDTDEDGVLDACDACEGADDLEGERLVLCSETPPPPVEDTEVDRVRGNFVFGYDPELGLLPEFVVDLFGGEASLPSIFFSLLDAGREVCTINRIATTAFPASELASTTASPLLTWTLTAENSEVLTDCDGRLDSIEWGDDIAAAVEAVDWSVSIVDSCPSDGCGFADAAIWAEVVGAGGSTAEDCDAFEELCTRSMVGAVLGTSIAGPLEDAEGGPTSLAYAFPADVELNYMGDGLGWLSAEEFIAVGGPMFVLGIIGYDVTANPIVGTLLAAP